LSLRKVDSPAYADLDWKMALASEINEAKREETAPAEGGEETPEPPAETE
jgi:hypothetical protein